MRFMVPPFGIVFGNDVKTAAKQGAGGSRPIDDPLAHCVPVGRIHCSFQVRGGEQWTYGPGHGATAIGRAAAPCKSFSALDRSTRVRGPLACGRRPALGGAIPGRHVLLDTKWTRVRP